MQAPWTRSDCLSALARGTELVFPTAAAAGSLRRAFDREQASAGRKAWQPARALSWSQWTRSLWNDLIVSGAENRLLLNTAQELQLWREVIASDQTAHPLLSSPESLAELCHSAWALACAFRCTANLRPAATLHDSRIFGSWAEEFARRSKARDLLSAAALDSALAQHLLTGVLTLSAPVHFVGFETLQPAQSELLNTAESTGASVIRVALRSEQHSAPLRTHTTVPDERTELRSAAVWLRSVLRNDPQNGSLAVAVLTPGPVDTLRDDLESVFRDVLTPELQDIAADLSSTPWTFSGGHPLASLPIVRDLLQLSRWTAAALPIESISPLLLSHFFAQGSDPETAAANASFDAFGLRQASLLRPELDLAAFQKLARRFAAAHPGRKPAPWAGPVAEFAASAGVSNASVERSYADWMEFIRGLARAGGWPGDRALSATEFEATRAWDGVLDLVATLDFSGRRVPFRDALAAVERAAQSTSFSPPSSGASIHVMSLPEAEGQIFDAAVLLHATDTGWPAAEGMNPLLGWSLQRRLHMPGADPSETAARARAQAENLLARCPNLLVLHAAEDRDGPTRPSPADRRTRPRSRPARRTSSAADRTRPLARGTCPGRRANPQSPRHRSSRRRLPPEAPGRLRLPRLR